MLRIRCSTTALPPPPTVPVISLSLSAADELGYVLHYFRLVGGMQVRQMRVTSNSCSERRFLGYCKDTVDPVTGAVRCVPR
jgi:hypothetical protein